MMIARAACASFALAIATTSPAVAATAPPDASVALEVTLPVDLKDPFIAYSLGLVPFGGLVAASYVGTSRTVGAPGPTHTLTGWAYNGLDVAFIAAYLYFSTPQTAATANSIAPLGAIASLVAIPLAHMSWFGPYWGSEAAKFNKDAMSRAGFKHHSQLEPYRPERGTRLELEQ